VTLLLDSHILLWWLSDDAKLSTTHRDLISDEAGEVLVSAITLAELSIKTSLGKLEITANLNRDIEANGFGFLPFTERHAGALRDLPFHHRDPFDRMLICQAQVDGLVFLTVDDNCRKYDILTR
jgi:PIN domain nuclease of toxin-antitoxin system